MSGRHFMADAHKLNDKYKSTVHYLLAALVPYTEANLKYVFSPREFSRDLAKLDYINRSKKHKDSSTKYLSAYYRAVNQCLIERSSDKPRLTRKGQRKLNSFQPKKLKNGEKIIAAFDVPEKERKLRNRLRALLEEFGFIKVQRSVWESTYDCIKYLKAILEEENMQKYVIIYQAGLVN